MIDENFEKEFLKRARSHNSKEHGDQLGVISPVGNFFCAVGIRDSEGNRPTGVFDTRNEAKKFLDNKTVN